MRPITDEKINLLTTFMEKEGIDVILIADWENARDVNMKYLSGHPMDASMVITAGGETCLAPWDLLLAEDHAQVDLILDTAEFADRLSGGAIHYIKEFVKKESPVIGVNQNIPYRIILDIKRTLPEAKIFDDIQKISTTFQDLRSTKSNQELDKLLEAGKMGSKAVEDIRKFAFEKDGTENDLSFIVMKKLREYGAADNSFPSLIANTTRAHMIHCHPSAGNNNFSENGLALIDYGALHEGYASDITIPITFGKLTAEQEKIRDTTIKAYEAAIESIDIGVPLWKISKAAVDIIEAAGYHMPHGLGHGLGLTVHDSPGVRQKPDTEEGMLSWKEQFVEDGMVFTIEPGIYSKGLGGQRLENDVMIRNGKVVVYTKSEPIEVD
ncbi:MAG TPA: M24 family metallopeptidase [Candidatus Bathyarchaeia archaeon]|nr:M24 family metallopeptidase [Candidatus Bathyarchaeia archaeon]